MKKKIYIHIGPPKTGTSVIQFLLNSHAGWLKKQGIYYPKHDLDSNSISSGHRALFLDKSPKLVRTIFNHKKFKLLLDDFNQTDCSMLLLSSEFFFYQVPEFLKYQNNYDVCIIAYVRADVELVESLYNQSVKRNGQVLPLAVRSRLPKSYLDDLTDYVKSYSTSVFLLRAYGNRDVLESGLASDLLSAIGLDEPPPSTVKYPKVNSSYSFECLEVKRWLNRFDLGGIEEQLDQLLQRYEGSGEEYTLLPVGIFASYKLQSLDKIVKLHALAPVQHYEKLVEFISKKQRGKYVHQSLYPSHLKKVCHYLFEENQDFYISLVMRIKPQIEEKSDIAYFGQMQALLYKGLSKGPKEGLLTAMINWFRK